MPAGRDAVERAATMIGQDRIVASPLAMAGVAATVADGRWRAPRLVATDKHETGPALDQGELSTLRALMRSVVTSGTGTALASVPGEVAGKSGTAEYGGGDPPPTHAWFIAFRGDLADRRPRRERALGRLGRRADRGALLPGAGRGPGERDAAAALEES